jgi:antitoxin component YwqK of YwqJK toxin-antitoxin module/tetratricopeptide (TPR) repeat protein
MKPLFAIIFGVLLNIQLSAQQDSLEFYDTKFILSKIFEAENNNDYEAAIQWIDKVNENDSIYNSLITNKVSYLLELEKYDEAIEICNKSLNEKNEFSYYYYLNLGVAYLRLKKYDKAIQTFNTALKEFPYQHMLYYNRGIAYEGLDNFKNAADDYIECIKINPFYQNAHLKLGFICYKNHQIAEALMCLNTYIFIDPENDFSLNLLSWLNTNVAAENKEENINIKISKDDKLFDEINLLIENYIALSKKYKYKNKIKLNIIKQTHLLLTQLQDFEGGDGFFSKTYVPFYRDIMKEGHFDGFVYHICQALQEGKYKSIVNANKAKIAAFVDWAIPKFYSYFSTRKMLIDGKEETVTFWLEDLKYLSAIGSMDLNTRKKTGPWQFYRPSGQLSTKGQFDENGERTGKWYWYHYNGKYKEILTFSEGKFNGIDSIFYDNGNLKIFAEYKDNLKNGNYYEYTAFGGMVEHSMYKDGKANGITKIYYPIGEGFIKYEATQKDNKIEGELIEKYDNGQIKTKSNFVDNSYEGPSETYFNDGKLYSKANYKEGKLEGKYIAYYRNGNVYKEGNYKDGVTVGEWKTYYEDGTPKYIENFDEKGKLNGHLMAYDMDGKLHYEYDYMKSDLVAYKYYDKKGNIIKESKKSKGKFWFEGYYPHGIKKLEGYYEFQGGQTGEWKYYDKDGILSSIEHYKDGNLEGLTTIYYPSGKISQKVFYKDGKKEGYYVSYYPNHVIKQQGYYKNDLAEGEWLTYFIDGTLQVKNYFHYDELQGKQYYYSPSGKLSSISIYNYGKEITYIYFDDKGNVIDTIHYDDKEPLKQILFPNKTVFKKGQYINGYAHGKHQWFFMNQKVNTEGEYFNHNKHGKWVWYYPNGKIETEGNYSYGDKHGTWKYYYENGKLEREETYKFDESIGTEKGYNENGTISYEVSFINGVKHGEQKLYSNNGELQLIRYYDYGIFKGYAYLGKDGKPVDMIPVNSSTYKVTGYFKNGNKSREYSVKNGEFDGKYIKYALNGNIIEDETYQNGDLIGEQKEYYANGKLKLLKNYNVGYLDGIQKYYHPNGKLKREESYKNGEKEGTWKYYDENERLIKEETYFDGKQMTEKVY